MRVFCSFHCQQLGKCCEIDCTVVLHTEAFLKILSVMSDVMRHIHVIDFVMTFKKLS